MSTKKEFNKVATLTHIALHVADVHKSAAFYKDWCDMEVIHEHETDIDGQPVMWLSSPDNSNFEIVLVPGRSDGGVETGREGMRHLGFDMPSMEKLEEIAERAQEEGILHWGLQTMNWPVGTVMAVKDPDGHIVEFSTGQPMAKDFKEKIHVKSCPLCKKEPS